MINVDFMWLKRRLQGLIREMKIIIIYNITFFLVWAYNLFASIVGHLKIVLEDMNNKCHTEEGL